MTNVENPDTVDVNGGHHTLLILNDENIVVNITSEGLIMDFWWDDSDGDPHATIGMTFDEWRDFATQMMETPR